MSKVLLLALTAAVACCSCMTGGALAAEDTPNVIFVLADDLGWGDVGYQGGPASTPNLDAMAAGQHSIQLKRQYSGGPVCSPTRGTVLTGRNHNRYCVWSANAGNNFPDFAKPEPMPLPTSEVTLPELLNERDYESAIFGKWHLGDLKPLYGGNKLWPKSTPKMHGFDRWWVTERSAPTSNLNCACFNATLCPRGHYSDLQPCTNYYSIDDETEELLVTFAQPATGDDSQFLVTRAIQFINETVNRGKPFFLYLPLHCVHIRYIASMPYIEKYTALGYDLNHTDYYGAISAMDDAIGKLRDFLQEINISENTILWFTSDNGPEHFTPGITGGYRGRKGGIFEGGIRVPGIIEWPAKIKSNTVSDFPVVTSDLLPTLCDLLNISLPKDRIIDGESLLPFILSHNGTRGASMKWAYNIGGDFNSTYSAAISGNKYKVYTDYKNGKVVDSYLFDLQEDPHETTDIKDKYPTVHKDMLMELEEWRQSVIHSAVDKVKCY